MAAGIAIPSLAYCGSTALAALHEKSAIMNSNIGVCFVWRILGILLWIYCTSWRRRWGFAQSPFQSIVVFYSKLNIYAIVSVFLREGFHVIEDEQNV